MTLPWDVPSSVPVDFRCKHCREVQIQSQGRLILCTCPGAIQEQFEERQRQDNWRKQQECIPRIRRKR